MNKLKNKNEKGITLIALVITIIVLLILAVVAINMAIDSDGLFGKANQAATGWNTAVKNEETAITNLLEKANSVVGTTVGGNGGGTEEPTDPENPTQPENPPALPEGWDSTKVSAVVKEGTRKAPIPVGYVASQIPTEDTISEGLVIYQGTDSVTGETNSTAHTTAMTTRNQFVWIPVDDIDYMVMCKSNAEGSVCDLELVNGVLQCTNETHTTKKTDLCGRVYATTTTNTIVDGKRVYTSSQTFNEAQWASQTWDTSSYREPDIVSDYDVDSTTGGLTAFTTQMTNDFVAMATSVAKYGGFYVSRYEVGKNGTSLKNQKVLVAGTKTINGNDANTFVNGNKWYGMYNTLRSSTAVDKTAVNSHMIWGSQYDMTIKFLGENTTNEPQIAHINRQLATQELTGETITDIMSNIYDLEGNNSEWTVRAYNSYMRDVRGGNYINVLNNSNYGPATYNSASTPIYAYPDCGSRGTLYF